MFRPLCTFLLASSIAILSGCTHRSVEPAAKPERIQTDVVSISTQAAQTAHILTVVVHETVTASDIQTTGQIQANENKVFHINSLAPGRVVEDKVSLGDTIHQGQVLAVIENLEVAKVYADFIRRYHENESAIKDAEVRFDLAKSTLTRDKQLFEEKILPQKDMLQAQADYALAERAVEALNEKGTHIEEEAKSLLAAYGVKLTNIQSEKLQTTSPIVAPRQGVITKKNITVGDVVNIQETLYEVADLSQVWLDVSVYDKDLASIKQGEAITFVSDSMPGRTFTGMISYIRPSTGDSTRTFLARADLANPDGTLKPGMFGQVTVSGANRQTKPFVPDDALQSYGNQKFVFVDDGDHKYSKRVVTVLRPATGGYLIESGLSAGDRIVAQGSLKLKAEMLKIQLGGED